MQYRVKNVFCDCFLAIYSTHVVNKVCDYSCLLLCVTSLCLSPHGPHTACSRVWWKTMGDWCTHSIHTSAALLGGRFEGCPAPLRGAGVWERCSWDSTWKLSNSAFTKITSSLGLFLQPHQTALRRGLFTGKGSRWAPLGFWFSETWSSCSPVFWHLWAQNLTQDKCDD